MTALVTLTDLQAYKHVADSVKNSTQWPQFVSEAQLFDVKINNIFLRRYDVNNIADALDIAIMRCLIFSSKH